MQRVVTVSLNGNTYQLDQPGYEALHAYLAQAEARLVGNPDRMEIVRDLEQSIAEKCQRHLGPGKTVVSTGEVDQILREIGPIDSDTPPAPPPLQGDTGSPRRLYQIREGAMLSGVCNGLAAYLNVDPTIVRIAFAGPTLLLMALDNDAAMAFPLLYVLFMFIVPYAKTPEQLAAAQGSSRDIPYKIQRMVERVKTKLGTVLQRAH
jgi:phage shock protein PspC (stress-responsive transcriptional regulator)